MKIEIMTCNSGYDENKECIGGYHEIHKINFVWDVSHAIATINSVIANNLMYGCESTILEDVIVSISDKVSAKEITKYYETYPSSVKVTVGFVLMP